MINIILDIAIAPIVILLFYIYVRDKYEKEPYMLMIIGITVGAIITPIIYFTEKYINEYIYNDVLINSSELINALFQAFLVAGFVEELVKYVFNYMFAYNNKEFNEPFDGIVYSTFIALGFAMVENILYVTNENVGGLNTAIVRSVTSVPVHAMYGVIMGFFIGNAKFTKDKNTKNKGKIKNRRNINKVLALVVPLLMHGLYDFTLMYEQIGNTFLFVVPIIIMAYLSNIMMKINLKNSPFRGKYNLKKYIEAKNEIENEIEIGKEK